MAIAGLSRGKKMRVLRDRRETASDAGSAGVGTGRDGGRDGGRGMARLAVDRWRPWIPAGACVVLAMALFLAVRASGTPAGLTGAVVSGALLLAGVCVALGRRMAAFSRGAADDRHPAAPGVAAPESGAALWRSEQRFSRLFEAAPIGIALVDLEGVVVECNRAFRTMTREAGADPVGGSFVEMIDPRDRSDVTARLESAVAHAGTLAPLEARLNLARESNVSLFASRLDHGDGEVTGVMVHIIDVTEQKKLELQFAQSQKLQAVGQLAGGIAHDFNNLLTAMMGFCDLLLMRHHAGDHSFADIMQIKQNANRAAGLVRQLLAFSRRQTLQPKVLALTDVLAELSSLLRRLIGANIELSLTHSRDLGLVRVDEGQIEQVIINLAVNARDAMPDGGTLTIRTSNVEPGAAGEAGHELLPWGDYVLIEVSDTGKGIAKEIQGKIFEPFFSTKEASSGTGLGLSTVYGIIKQTGGYIFVNSEPGEGAVFSVFLPRHFADEHEEIESRPAVRRETPKDLTGKGTILLVEDEDGVRNFAARALRGKGYSVLEASSGEAALEVINSYGGQIDLLVTDVVMPRMDGTALAERIREDRPGLKVLLISGYAEDTFRRRRDRPETTYFLPKPFSLADLAGKVKDVLEAPPLASAPLAPAAAPPTKAAAPPTGARSAIVRAPAGRVAGD